MKNLKYLKAAFYTLLPKNTKVYFADLRGELTGQCKIMYSILYVEAYCSDGKSHWINIEALIDVETLQLKQQFLTPKPVLKQKMLSMAIQEVVND